MDEFGLLNAEVVGISVDSEYAHLTWSQLPRKEGGLSPLRIPLVSDITKKISKSYGVLHDESVALRFTTRLTPRGLFIVDDKGVVRHTTVNDLGIGRSVDETLRTIKAIQFNDKHGEVCPANWNAGSQTVRTRIQYSR